MKRRNAKLADGGEQLPPGESSSSSSPLPSPKASKLPKEALKSPKNDAALKYGPKSSSLKILCCATITIVIILVMKTLTYFHVEEALAYFPAEEPGIATATKEIRQYTSVPEKNRGLFVGTDKIAMYLKQRGGYTRTKNSSVAEYVWAHSYRDFKNITLDTLKPWQRANHLPNERLLSEKSIFLETMMEYAARKGDDTAINFMPETYRLYDEKDTRNFLHLLEVGGIHEAWVLKRPQKDGGKGVTVLGPTSKELRQLATSLRDDPNYGGTSNKSKNRLIVQKYVTNLLTYHGRKFDLRMHCLVASSVPFVVFYHDGTLRISLKTFDEKDFSSKKAHLTNYSVQKKSSQQQGGTNRTKPEENIEDARASFYDLKDYLKEHVSQNQNLSHITEPLQHIRNQIKDATAKIFEAFHHVISVDVTKDGKKLCTAENGFSLLGADFMVDSDLKVWITEMQSGPGMSHSTNGTKKNFAVVVPGIFEILEEVKARERSGEPIDEMESPNSWELIYNDNFRFTYSGTVAGA